MPLLFAVTLFASASLLFMVQPMVGKMVLPLLGGSPAVWNACMVFFQALLLLGYLYADRVSTRLEPRRQWAVHLPVMLTAIAVMGLAVVIGQRHTPIAIAESLAPSQYIGPIVSVLALLTVAIGVPFFVASTSAPLLQKWFAFTGHPAARDPYFLYAASNAGSLISLLGYPFFIEPYLPVAGQTWVWALGFAGLVGMIALCGRAAAYPVAVPPASAKLPADGKAAALTEPVLPPVEAPPSTLRKLKWIALAFVPSSLMLGVTFHMATDIASIPLLWVFPLALYLVTFIIAFGRVPNWFRLVIGNMAPVMILLLVFVMVSDAIAAQVGLTLMLHLATFFAAALMCHYELARDRPGTAYLTQFFLLMSVGGVLGGLFNSIIAPLAFPLAYEYPLALIVACLLVPQLTTVEDETEAAKEAARGDTRAPSAAAYARCFAVGLLLGAAVLAATYGAFRLGKQFGHIEEGEQDRLYGYVLAGAVLALVLLPYPVAKLYEAVSKRRLGTVRRVEGRYRPWQVSAVLDGLAPVLMGGLFWAMLQLGNESEYHRAVGWFRRTFSLPDRLNVAIIPIYAGPVMLCFFFVDRPVRFALSVAAILGISTFQERGRDVIYTERSFFGILKVEDHPSYFYLRRPDDTIARFPDGKPMLMGTIEYRRLVHGTTLHGTQIAKLDNHLLDHFQQIAGPSPWDNLLITGSILSFDPRQEPLTYYHRTGPVGAMVHELRTRKNGADRHAHISMVGLGTGSASCYALGPARPGDPDYNPTGDNPPQKLDFYEIDKAVKRLVADQDTYFTFVSGARRRGAIVDVHLGDARLKIQENADRRYALLMIDAFSSDSIPIHLLTKEAVGLYFDRMTPDGLLALHISNKFVNLEPVVAKIAEDLGVEARVWNDSGEKRPGKTASSWVVLGRDLKTLGGLYSPIGDLFRKYPGYYQLRYVLMAAHESEVKTVKEFETKDNSRGEAVAWLKKKGDPESMLLADLVEKFGLYTTLNDAMVLEVGHAFRPLKVVKNVDAWTDDYSDVLRVMTISEVKWLRKQAGLPTLGDDE